jgi:SPP1 family predicted phage head-tail adaptor
MDKTKFSCFNDGVVSIYREKEKLSSFKAKKNVSELGDLDFIVKLDFEESSKRERDLEFAEQLGYSLTMKIHTRYMLCVDNSCKAIINGYLYDIFEVDKQRNEMWLYLEGVKKLDT